MSRLGVVVASRGQHGTPPPAWQRLVAELAADDELVWVDAGPAPSGPWSGTTHLRAPQASRGHAYATGVQALTSDVVALTDEDTLVEPGWRSALLSAVDATSPAAGGPVRLSGHGPRRSVAGRLVDYAPHAVPPYLSATRDVAGNNVAYHRAVLDQGGKALWKSDLDARLARLGRPVGLVTGMAARCTRDYSWADLLTGRLASGRVYGAQRGHGRPRLVRGFWAARCLALPALRVARLARTCRPDPELRRALARVLPEVVLAEVSWSVGEAVGCLAGEGGKTRAW